MNPEEATKGVHSHKYFYRVSPDKAMDAIFAIAI
jgi:hypothetical protein